MRKFVLAILLFITVNQLFAQNNFCNPMDINLQYAGNFGEIRPNHFHTGVDIKTGGRIGKKIYSIDDGYVSRIKIQLWGYGKVLYVTHPNGYTSVYAHLSRFSPKIDSIVKENQYDQQSYTLDLYLYKNQIKVKKHEVIGFSGNTGNSFAPHLHFEIRDTKTEYAQNPYIFNFKPKTDNIAPRISGLYIYPIDSNSLINTSNNKQNIKLKQHTNNINSYYFDTVNITGNVGFGVSVLDYVNNSRNKFAPYSIELFIDSVKYISIKFDEFDFYDKNYINSYIDYKAYLQNKTKIHKLFIEENNKLKNYKYSKNNGIVNFKDNKTHHVKIIVKDFNKNTAEISGFIYTKEFYPKNFEADTSKIFMKFFKDNFYATNDFFIEIKKSALIKSMYFDYSTDKNNGLLYSDIYNIGNVFVPLYKKIKIGINTENVPKKYLDKIIIVKIDKNKYTSYKGKLEKSYLVCKTNKFGSYAIMADTTAPVIKAINIFDGAKFINDKSIRFKISDNLSGIYKINGYIDNKWVCFEYDPKKASIAYYFDKKISKNKYHDFKLEVSDYKNNTSTYTAKIFY